MTTTLQAHGGGAQPASIDTSGKVAGGAAQRVYGFDGAEDARAAGYVCEGGPAMSVALITDAQIASGAWKAEGDPAALVVYTAPANLPVEGGYAVPVYPVNGWGRAPAPSGPQFGSAEIGTVNASTLVVTFDSNVNASNYATGVTIKVNGAATSITSAIRQSDNHAKVNYTIPVLWHGSGDAVTWEYASGSGNIVAESDATPLGNVSAQSVTNSVEYNTLLGTDLQADVLSPGLVSTWADQTPSGTHSFSQTGDARPTAQIVDGYMAVTFDGVDDSMIGGDWGDNLGTFTIIAASRIPPSIPGRMTLISKISSYGSGQGWTIDFGGYNALFQMDGGSVYFDVSNGDATPTPPYSVVSTMEKIDNSHVNLYYNSVQSSLVTDDAGPVLDFGTTEPVRLGITGSAADKNNKGDYFSLMMFSPIPNAANRAALEARLAARYGVTL